MSHIVDTLSINQINLVFCCIKYILMQNALNIFRKKSERMAILQSLADKVQWFKDHIKPEGKNCSIQDIHDLINV